MTSGTNLIWENKSSCHRHRCLSPNFGGENRVLGTPNGVSDARRGRKPVILPPPSVSKGLVIKLYTRGRPTTVRKWRFEGPIAASAASEGSCVAEGPRATQGFRGLRPPEKLYTRGRPTSVRKIIVENLLEIRKLFVSLRSPKKWAGVNNSLINTKLTTKCLD